jgi:hypothetical protein
MICLLMGVLDGDALHREGQLAGLALAIGDVERPGILCGNAILVPIFSANHPRSVVVGLPDE